MISDGRSVTDFASSSAASIRSSEELISSRCTDQP